MGDQFYAVAVKGYDADDKKALVEAGIAELDAAAKTLGHASYAAIGWEEDRVKVLQSIEKSTFFQTVRAGLVTGSITRKRCGRSLATRAKAIRRAATSPAVSTTSTGCRRTGPWLLNMT